MIEAGKKYFVVRPHEPSSIETGECIGFKRDHVIIEYKNGLREYITPDRVYSSFGDALKHAYNERLGISPVKKLQQRVYKDTGCNPLTKFIRWFKRKG